MSSVEDFSSFIYSKGIIFNVFFNRLNKINYRGNLSIAARRGRGGIRSRVLAHWEWEG